MAQVPVYNGQQVALNPLQFDQATPDQFGAQAGRELSALGGALGSVVNAGAKVVERDALREVMDAEASAKEAYINWSAETLQNSQGAAAQGVAARAKDWWEKTTAETAEKLSNPLAQRMYRSAAKKQMLASLSEFSRFEIQQLDADLVQKTDATVSQSAKLAARIPTDENIKVQAEAIRGAIAAYGNGRMSPEVIREKTERAIHAMNYDVFNTLLVRDPIGAEAYYKNNRKDFNPAQFDSIEGRLKTAVADAEGATAARDIVASVTKGLKPTDAFPVGQIEADLDKKFGGKPEVLRAARAEADRKMAVWNRQQAETTAAAVGTVMDALNQGSGLNVAKRMPAWNDMTGEQRASIEQRYLDRLEMLANRREADADRADRRRERLERKQFEDMAPVALEMAQPEKLARMTREDILNQQHRLGPKLTASVLKEWEEYQKDTVKLQNAKVDNDIFKTLMLDAGYDPVPKATNKEASAFALEMRDRVRARLAGVQLAHRRELTDEEKRQEMGKVISAAVLMPAGLKGRYNTAPEYKVDPAEVNRKGSVSITYVDDKGARRTGAWKLSSIPQEEYASAVLALKKQGNAAPTLQEVAQFWYDWAWSRSEKKR
jgi:hypothetical protein